MPIKGRREEYEKKKKQMLFGSRSIDGGRTNVVFADEGRGEAVL